MLVDDHAVVRRGLAELIEDEADMEVVAAASDGEEAVALAGETRPDIILMDVSMPGMDGMEATRRITTAAPAARVLMLTSFSGRERISEALGAGAVGYILKDAEPYDLLRRIRSAAEAARHEDV